LAEKETNKELFINAIHGDFIVSRKNPNKIITTYNKLTNIVIVDFPYFEHTNNELYDVYLNSINEIINYIDIVLFLTNEQNILNDIREKELFNNIKKLINKNFYNGNCVMLVVVIINNENTIFDNIIENYKTLIGYKYIFKFSSANFLISTLFEKKTWIYNDENIIDLLHDLNIKGDDIKSQKLIFKSDIDNETILFYCDYSNKLLSFINKYNRETYINNYLIFIFSLLFKNNEVINDLNKFVYIFNKYKMEFNSTKNKLLETLLIKQINTLVNEKSQNLNIIIPSLLVWSQATNDYFINNNLYEIILKNKCLDFDNYCFVLEYLLVNCDEINKKTNIIYELFRCNGVYDKNFIIKHNCYNIIENKTYDIEILYNNLDDYNWIFENISLFIKNISFRIKNILKFNIKEINIIYLKLLLSIVPLNIIKNWNNNNKIPVFDKKFNELLQFYILNEKNDNMILYNNLFDLENLLGTKFKIFNDMTNDLLCYA